MIGYLPESAPLYGDIIVYDYLRYVTQIRGISNFEKIDEIAAICGITEVMHKYIYELSKGYKQRVGLAGAMIHDPSILILDEPTSGLDPNQIIEIRNLIRELGKKKTVILSTHILPEVEATCDRVIIIDKGKIVADDTTDNLKSGLTGQQTISLTVACENFSLLIAKLKNINGVSDVEEIRNSDFTSVRIIANGAIEVRPEIFKMSVDNNWVIYELTREQNTLENIFRQLTAGGENVH
jgi:ABC-2 type transport system ATP-binding protein